MQIEKDESRKLGVKIIGNDAGHTLVELGRMLVTTGEELLESGESWKLTKGGLKQLTEPHTCLCDQRQIFTVHSDECQAAEAAHVQERLYFWLLLKSGTSSLAAEDVE